MPTGAEHCQKITHNRAFVSLLKTDEPSFLDWAVTGLFHIAVHQIERYAWEKARQHLRTHYTREQFFARNPDLRAIWGDYQHLKTQSEDARYEVSATTAEDLEEAENLLRHIETHVEQLLS